MATLDNLADAGHLKRYALPSHDDRQRERFLFLSSGCVQWLTGALRALPRDRSKELEPWEQVKDAFDRYISDPRLTGVGEWVNINPQSQGVYEIKTTDVRVLGWFWRPRQFVAVCGDSKKACKARGRMAQLRGQVVSFRGSLPLDPPEFRRHRINVREFL